MKIKKRHWRWMPLVLLMVLLSCSPNSGSPPNHHKIKQLLEMIPNDHRQRLEAFFENLILDSSAAYTLFGAKPWSIEWYAVGALGMSPYHLYNPQSSLAFSLGWDSWKQYGHLFPSESFLLRCVELSDRPSHWYVIVMNKPAVLETLKHHLGLFQKALGGHQTPEEIWAQMECSDEILERITSHSELLGILLGYGGANAHAFRRRSEICVYLAQCMRPPMAPLAETEKLSSQSQFFVNLLRNNAKEAKVDPEPIAPDPGFATLADELNAICERLSRSDFLGFDIIEQFSPPQFAALRDDPETDHWYQSYAETRKELSHVVQDRSIFEAALIQWTSGSARSI